MAEPIRTRIQHRAQHAGGYCRLPQRASILPHQIDHIIAQQHMGPDEESNLCLCYLRCNLKKGRNVASTAPEAGSAYRIAALFHPRTPRWYVRFQLREDGRIEGTNVYHLLLTTIPRTYSSAVVVHRPL